jgi:hypothetical protein
VCLSTLPFLDIIHRRMCVIGQDDVEMNGGNQCECCSELLLPFPGRIEERLKMAGIVMNIRAVNSHMYKLFALSLQLTCSVRSADKIRSFLCSCSVIHCG